ncbi:MAG TPA: hypothetical protein VGX48_23230 [Pyrinomonadaceae bacterium]|jgi:predicted glycosyltransferase|nr:hypothetical protein [Pyrinomonadaceae bacterium]
MSHKLRRLKIVAYAVNGSGLGHLTRVLAVLRWAGRLARLSGVRLETYVLTSSEAPGLAFEEGFATFKIPSKTAVRRAGLPKEEYLRLARQWVWHSVGLVQPDVLLVDTFPGGSFGELIHALDVARARVFIRRAVKEEFARAAGVRSLLPLYDRILVPGEPDAPPPEADASVAAKTRHVGPIMLRSREELRPREEARRRLGIPDGKLAVWLSAGGGGDPHAGSAVERLVGALRAEPDLHLVVGAGPLYGGAPLRGPNITWVADFNAMQDFAGLDFAVSAAGYNSFHELLHARVPVAFFAQEKVADEQARRVRAASEAGCALSVGTAADGGPRVEDLRRVLEEFRDAGRRAEIALRAGEFVPANSARDAAFEVLATVLPLDVLEEAAEIGTPDFFLTLAAHGVEAEDVERVNRRLKTVAELDAEERRDLMLRLVSQAGTDGRAAVRLFTALAPQVSVVTQADAEELVGAATRVAASASFADERALSELLRALPVDERTRAAELAEALCRFLGALDARGDSVWRGRSVLARHLAGARVTEALAAAAEEIQNGSLAPTDFQGDAFTGDEHGRSYGD